MHWIAPSEKDTATATLEKRLWDAAKQAVPAPHFAETDFNGGRPQGLPGLILGDTFTKDGFDRAAAGKKWTFNYMLANPPFGVEWKQEQR